jgi:hypothetical protein
LELGIITFLNLAQNPFKTPPMNDVFGSAILDYQEGNYTEDLVTSTSISEEDTLALPYLCGAGSHSLHLISKGLNVKSIDISEGAIKACKLRGLKSAHVLDVMNETATFDTLLLLMNGSGIFQSLAHTPLVLKHLITLLNPEGQILIDSSDIKYMYQDDDGGYWMDTNKAYYGELDYTVRYKGKEATFRWMYLDFEHLKIACNQVGLKCELIEKGPHYDFLARLTVD